MNFNTIAFRALASALVIATATLVQASEHISIEYHFAGSTGVNLSAMTGGPLSINTFSDGRENINAYQISRPDRQPLTINTTPSRLVQSAFEQAFNASGATLSEEGSSLSLDGKLIEMQVFETDDGIQVLIRCELTLRIQSRNAWQSVLFSQVTTDEPNIETALTLGLNRLVSELFMDDYFLMELGIF